HRRVLVPAVGERNDGLAPARGIAQVAAGVVERVVEGGIASGHGDAGEGAPQVLGPRRPWLYEARLVVEGDERRLGPRPELRQDAQGQLPGTVQARLSDAAGGVEGQDHDDRRLLGLDGEDKRAGETEKD